MNDFLTGIKDAFSSRFGSVMYGTFILARLTTNWKIWVTLFFIDEGILLSKHGFLKIDYISDFYRFDSFISILFTILKLFIVPALATFIIHWWLAKVETKIYKKSLLNKTDRKLIKVQEDEKYQSKILSLEKQRANYLVEKEKNEKKEKEIEENKIISEEDIWAEEYMKLNENDFFLSTMAGLQRIVYSNKGYYTGNDGLNEKMLSFLDVNDLISIDENRLEITPKGKFFMKKIITG